jgi:hypothetical protein
MSHTQKQKCHFSFVCEFYSLSWDQEMHHFTMANHKLFSSAEQRPALAFKRLGELPKIFWLSTNFLFTLLLSNSVFPMMGSLHSKAESLFYYTNTSKQSREVEFILQVKLMYLGVILVRYVSHLSKLNVA